MQFQLKISGKELQLYRHEQLVATLFQPKWYRNDAIIRLANSDEVDLKISGFWKSKFRVEFYGEIVMESNSDLNEKFDWPLVDGARMLIRLNYQGSEPLNCSVLGEEPICNLNFRQNWFAHHMKVDLETFDAIAALRLPEVFLLTLVYLGQNMFYQRQS